MTRLFSETELWQHDRHRAAAARLCDLVGIFYPRSNDHRFAESALCGVGIMPRVSVELKVGCKVSVLAKSLLPRATAKLWLTPEGAHSIPKNTRIGGVVTEIKDVESGGNMQKRVFFSHEKFREAGVLWCHAGGQCTPFFFRAIFFARFLRNGHSLSLAHIGCCHR